MNAIIPVHPPAALWDRYVSLLPNLKLLVRLDLVAWTTRVV
jgi:hypothetical protein